MSAMPGEVVIEYIRPGKDVQRFVEDLVVENSEYLKTFKWFPPEISESLTRSLRENGFISEIQHTACITKLYFFHNYFDLLQFQDENRQTLGYYSDIATPLRKTRRGYQMTDWFLDIWLSPDGTLFELDWDEFEVALANNLLHPTEAELARSTFDRLIHEINQGIYPHTYLK